jgi:hypothetical protein
MERSIQARFVEDGFAIVRGVLSPSEVARYVGRLRELAGAAACWTEPDGVSRHAEFWPIIFDERVLSNVRDIFGPAVRYLPHTDLHVGFSSFSWHRDSVARRFGDGADWRESDATYQIARVGIYLQRFDESGFRIGFVKGSHRFTGLTGARRRRVERRTSTAANILAGLSGVDFLGADAEWIAPDAGDCVIFDPRVLHTGSRFRGRKYSIFLAYGVENAHFQNHWHYYLRLRRDLGYSTVSPALADRLQAAGLLAHEPPLDLTLDRAWIPSAAYVSVARRFK